MLDVIPMPSPRVIGFRISGRIEAEDVARGVQALEAALADHRRLRIYAEVQKLDGMSLGALLDDLRASLRHFTDIEREAVVTDQRWLATLAGVGGAVLPGVEVRHFPFEERNRARDWILDGLVDAAPEPTEDPVSELSLAIARRIADTVLAKGRELALEPLTVVVLDAGGHPKCLMREDGSGLLRADIATGKAWGALGMGFGSRTLAARAAGGAQSAAFVGALNAMSGGRAVPAAGGVLVRGANERVLGAVGVSGDASDKDEACAVAGIEAAGLRADPG